LGDSDRDGTSVGPESVGFVNEQRYKALEQYYAFVEPSKVLHFVSTHPDLIPVLLEAHEVMKEHFPSSEIMLKISPGREEAEEDQLFAYILTSYPVDEALAKLDAIDETWFLNRATQVKDRFNFNLAFV
jgi:hypothetical protein